MKIILGWTLAAALGLGACVSLSPDTRPQTIDRPIVVTQGDNACSFGSRTYRPTPDDKAPYDATIPPSYDAPSQLPAACKKLGN